MPDNTLFWFVVVFNVVLDMIAAFVFWVIVSAGKDQPEIEETKEPQAFPVHDVDLGLIERKE